MIIYVLAVLTALALGFLIGLQKRSKNQDIKQIVDEGGMDALSKHVLNFVVGITKANIPPYIKMGMATVLGATSAELYTTIQKAVLHDADESNELTCTGAAREIEFGETVSEQWQKRANAIDKAIEKLGELTSHT